MTPLKFYKIVDVHFFQEYIEENFNITDKTFQKTIWIPHLSESLINDHWITFSFTENPETLLDSYINVFLLDYPELDNKVSLTFTD
jgi:hypothetical protein